MKLGIGTVQFGLDYGISNTKGKVSDHEIKTILEEAKTQGIDTLDTAQNYGESESVLGKHNLSGFKIISKVKGDFSVETSLKKLNISRLYGVLLHDEKELNSKNWDQLQSDKKAGLIQKIGISVYNPKTVLDAIKSYSIDIIQLPINALDQRFVPLLSELKKRDIEVHARSVFLQGLLLMDFEKIDPYFNEIMPILKQIPKQKLEFALQFVDRLKEIDKIIVGVTSKEELQKNINALLAPKQNIDYAKYSVYNEDFILPQNWRLQSIS